MTKILINRGIGCCMLILFLLHTVGFARELTVDSNRVTIKKNSIALVDLFDIIKKQTGLTIFYNSNILNDKETVKVNFNSTPLSQVLGEILTKRSITWRIQNSFVVLKKKEANESPGLQTDNHVAINIIGVVTGEKEQGLTGVTIRVKDTNIYTVTKGGGNYKIPVPNEGAILVFSFVGYKSQEVSLRGKRTINVALVYDESKLNEIVVIGYGTVKKGDLTGSVGQVNISEFSNAPVKSLDGAMAGRIAGVSVSSTDGQPGVNNTIVIRGSNSLTQDNSPLYVVDGFPIENPDINQISSADIESISVLKDASASAIYGSRGANGVIIITTKRGKKGDPVLTYNGYYGLQKDYNRPVMKTGYDFLIYQVARFGSGSVYPKYDISPNKLSLEDYKNMPSIDWQEKLLSTAPMFNNDLSIRGGTDKTLYSISLNALNQDGLILNSGFKRYSGRLVLDQNINSKLKIGVNGSYNFTKNYGLIVTSGGGNNLTSNLMVQTMGYRPVSGTTNQSALEGDLIDPGLSGVSSNPNLLINPVISAENEIRVNRSHGILINGYASYLVLPQLTLRIAGGMNNAFNRSENFNNSNTVSGNPKYNAAGVNGSITNVQLSNWSNENTLTYSKIFNRMHNLSVLGGFSMQGNNTFINGLSATNVPNESLGIDGLDESTALTIRSQNSTNTLASFLGRINYSYKSKYLFTASLRRDGSSKFVDKNRWGWFPSAAVAWKMAEESFLKKSDIISEAKLRLSFGLTGNNRVNDFPYLSQIGLSPTLGNYSFNNVIYTGTRLTAIGSKDLKWETTSAVDIGYDLGLFKNKVSIVVDVYRKTTKDLLLNANIPYTTGFITAFRNIGKMQNQGLEITLNTTNTKTKNFSWETNFNISFNQNKILALTENEQSIKQSTNDWNSSLSTPPYIGLIDQPLAQFYGLIWNGVYQINDFDKLPDGRYILKNNVTTNGTNRNLIQPGDIKYQDLNGDLVIDAKDNTVIGRALPTHTGGFSNNFNYKGFGLNMLLQWSYGNKVMNANRLIFEGNWRNYEGLNQLASYKDWWTIDNQNSTLFRPAGNGPIVYSNRILENGSYLRLKTVNLDYTLSEKVAKKLKLRSARIYVAAQNLYTFSGYSGRDPDVSSRNSILTPGFDYAGYPQARTIVLGFNTSL